MYLVVLFVSAIYYIILYPYSLHFFDTGWYYIAVCVSLVSSLCYAHVSELCFMSPLYFFKKHNISNIYNEVSVNILNFLNIGLQEVRLCVPVINLMTFFL